MMLVLLLLLLLLVGLVLQRSNCADVISTIAGTGTASYSGDGAAATSGTLNDPSGVAVDSSGNHLECVTALLFTQFDP